MKSTLIFIFFLLVGYRMPRFAAFYVWFRFSFWYKKCSYVKLTFDKCPFRGKSRQNKAKCCIQTDTNRIRILDKSIRLNYGAIVKKWTQPCNDEHGGFTFNDSVLLEIFPLCFMCNFSYQSSVICKERRTSNILIAFILSCNCR